MADIDPQTLSREIDELLEKYLGLLDQYTTLREQLSTVQASIQQNISRANFTADRGIRYGADYYDSRMQASRTCVVKSESEFTVQIAEAGRIETETKTGSESADEEREKKEEENNKKAKDPIRMFGILTPQALKIAQGEAVKLVEEIVPVLVRVGKEMETVEIEVRRKRKYRAKAEARTEVQKGAVGIVA